MANSQFLPPVIEPGESETKYSPSLRPDSDVHLSGDLSSTTEEGVFASLISSVRDVFFPVKLPPLELTSTPIAVPDRMAVRRDPKSTAIAVVAHVVVIGLIVWLLANKVLVKAPEKKTEITLVEPPTPPKAPPKLEVMGGGGGQKGPTPVSRGNPPKFEAQPILPPVQPPKIQPKLAVDPSINVQTDLKMAKIDTPNIGMSNSPLVGMSMGNGNGSGLGSGNGNGMGPGSGGNTGGGLEHIGGGVSAPIPIYQPEPEFSEEARKAKVAGNVLVYLEVDATGRPRNVRVVRGIGLGLDEKAMEAVRQYKFKPAKKDGKPVTVEMNVEVNFQIF